MPALPFTSCPPRPARRFEDPSSLPAPATPTVTTRKAPASYVAALRFSGWPLDWEVVRAERGLRDCLLRDGLLPEPGYQLARYNEPTVPPFLRRNEVLIRLEGYVWPPPQEAVAPQQ